MQQMLEQMLISDTNIFIDLECCGFTVLMFELPYRFCTPDILFDQELKQQHAHLLDIGLEILILKPESIRFSFHLLARYGKTSIHDLMALSLAKQENCPLLTGDKALRDAAQNEDIQVRGTIWILEELITHNKISKDDAIEALEKMENAGRRLPFDEAKKRLMNID